jgi:lipopolysaccharide assembly protein A
MLKLILQLILIILIAVIVASNAHSVQVSFLFWNVNLPLIMVILVSILLGVLITLPVFLKNRKKTAEKDTNKKGHFQADKRKP